MNSVVGAARKTGATRIDGPAEATTMVVETIFARWIGGGEAGYLCLGGAF